MKSPLRTLLSIALFGLCAVIVLDPADLVIGIKVPLYCAVWGVALLIVLFESQAELPLGLAVHATAFAVLLPLASMAYYYLLTSGSTQLYDGPKILKAHLFALLAIPLVLTRAKIVPYLSFVLGSAAVATIGLTIALQGNMALKTALWLEFRDYKVIAATYRGYGPWRIEAAYFAAAPMMVVAIAYLVFKTMHSEGKAHKIYFALSVIVCFGTFIGGTRNCILASLITPALILWWYGSKRQRTFVLAAGIVAVVLIALFASGVVMGMFSLEEEGNAIRLADYRDYMRVFADPVVVAFGQGVGSYFETTYYGRTTFSELTYLNVLREYGIVGSIPFFGLLLYPLTRLLDQRFKPRHYIFIAYGMYLAICISDPFFVSSAGMSIFAIVLSETYQPTTAIEGRYQQ